MKRYAVLSTANVFFAAAVLTSSSGATTAEKAMDPLAEGFRLPPNAAKPRVWWHWVDGQITKEGIAKDLGWMSRVGIGGVDAVEVSQGNPKVVEKPMLHCTRPV